MFEYQISLYSLPFFQHYFLTLTSSPVVIYTRFFTSVIALMASKGATSSPGMATRSGRAGKRVQNENNANISNTPSKRARTGNDSANDNNRRKFLLRLVSWLLY